METPICEFWIMNFILEKWDDHCRFCAEIMSRTVTKQFSWLIYSWCIVSPAFLGETWWNNISVHDRRKFRSQTSDNMDRWKSRDGKSQRREEQKREDQRRERVRRKKMQVREKVEKSQFTVSFQWFVAAEGRKVGSLKRRVRSHVARWEMKTCTPCGAKHISNSKCTKHTILGPLLEGWAVESARRCGAKQISKSKCTKHLNVEALLEIEMPKSARRCGAKHISKSKRTKHTTFEALLEVEMSKKCTPLWR